MSHAKLLNPEKALVFRITHVRNVPWLLERGLHCRAAETIDPGFVAIGNQELIEKRQTRPVPVPPGGTLSDYVPFYFTPWSPMLFNIKTGWGGVTRRSQSEIAIVVSSLSHLEEHGVTWVVTDRHAYLAHARFSGAWSDAAEYVPWDDLQHRRFTKDPEDPGPFERYQAEALAHRHVPPEGLLGIVCYTDGVAASIERERAARRLDLKVLAREGWYF